MKIRWVILCSAATLATATGARAEKTELGSAPAPVQQAIRAEAGAAPIEDLDREVRDGRTVYEAAFKRNGVHTEILVGEDGTLISQDPNAAQSAAPTIMLQDARKIEFSELPALAARTVRLQAKDAVIEDVDMGTFAGRTVYQVAFKDQQGQHREIIVTREGVLLHPAATPPGSPAAAPVAQNWVDPVATEMPLSQAPQEVQVALQAHAQGMPVERVNKLRVANNDYYQVQIVQDRKPVDLRVDAKGNLVDSRYRRMTASKLVPLSDARKIELSEVPPQLQTEMRRQAGQARIEDIDVGTWNGQTVYQVAFKSNDKHTEVQFLEDGHLLADQRMDRVNIGVGSAPEADTGSAAQADDIISAPASTKLEFNQLPITVRRAVQAHAGPAPIEDIDRIVRDGKVEYEVGYKVNGEHTELRIDSRGRVIEKE